jgi:ABC-type glycerol-3-phosphate transport system permease component
MDLRKSRLSKTFGRLLIYLILAAGAFVILIPFAWTISTALKTTQQSLKIPPVWIPDPVVWQNFATAWNAKPFATFYANSIIVSFFAIVGEILSCSFVAYGFARLRFPGRDVLFLILLGRLMIRSRFSSSRDSYCSSN